MEQEVASLRAELERERQRARELARELEAERGRSERIMENVQEDHREKVKRLNHKIIDLERDLKRSANSSMLGDSQKVSELEGKLETARKQNERLNHRIIGLEKDLNASLVGDGVRVVELERELETAKKQNQRLLRRLDAAHQAEDDLISALNLNRELHKQLEASRASRIEMSEDGEEIEELREKLAVAEQEVSELKQELVGFGDAKSSKHLRAHVEMLRKQVDERDVQVAELEKKNGELKAELENTKLDVGLLKHETEILRTSMIEGDGEIVQDTGELGRLLAIIDRQSRELADVSTQRNKLMEMVRNLEEALREAEKAERKVDLESESSESSVGLEKLFEQVLDIVPRVVREFALDLTDIPLDVRIFEIVRLLVDAQAKFISRPPVVTQVVQNDADILGHLENAMKFIRTLAGSAKDLDVKKAIYRQCEVIRSFINEKEINPANVPSVFVSEDYEDTMKSVLQLIDDEEFVSSSPGKELVTLFSGVIGVNALLTNRVKQLHMQHQKSQRDIAAEQAAKERALAKATEESGAMKKIREKLCTVVEAPGDVFQAVDLAVSTIESLADTCKSYRETIAEQWETITAMKKADMTEVLEKKCHKRGKVIAALKSSLELEQEKTNTTLRELSIQMDEAEQKVAENAVSQRELDEMKAKLEHMRKYKGKAKILEEGLANLEQKKRELEVALEDLLNVNERLTRANENLKSKVNDAKIQSARDQGRRADLKKRVQELESENKDAIAELRRGYEKLQLTHQETQDKLEQQLEAARESCLRYQERIIELESKKREHQQMLVKSKITEGTLTASLQDVLISMDNAKALIISQKRAFKTQMDDVKAEFIDYINKYRRCLLATLGLDPDELLTMGETIALASELYDPVLMDQAKEARRILLLEDDETIMDGISALTLAIKDRDKQIDTQKRELAAFAKDSATLKAALQDSQAKQKQMRKWSEWANALYIFALNDRIVPADEDDLRAELEDLVTSSCAASRSNRKLQILRTEKVALKLFGDQLTKHKRPHSLSCASIRPAIIVFLFAKRLSDLATKPSHV